MTFLTYLACIAIGLFLGMALVCYLLHRSHENFRKMFHESPKGK